ncbi:hypothetical protein JEQ12_001724 [Ovis aries]|uniref:Uncharacterized protein n=1 Tax=Ovis aries TaxID=9940 RepID=A0A836AK37_SHEEP|nr:hypothetical protein JEQ12_001724 [Ovis aries]
MIENISPKSDEFYMNFEKPTATASKWAQSQKMRSKTSLVMRKRIRLYRNALKESRSLALASSRHLGPAAEAGRSPRAPAVAELGAPGRQEDMTHVATPPPRNLGD